MELLIVTHRFPYPTRTGDTLTVFHLLKHFSQRHTLDLVSCTNRDPNREYLDAVAPFCRSVHTVPVSPLRSAINGVGAVLRRKPLQSDWFYTSRISRTIEQLIRCNRYDVLYAHTVRTARYITELNPQSPALRVLAMQISMQLNYRRLARYESKPPLPTHLQSRSIPSCDLRVRVGRALRPYPGDIRGRPCRDS